MPFVAVAGGGHLYCDLPEGHDGQHSHTFPMRFSYPSDSHKEAARYRKALQHIDEITTGEHRTTYLIKEIIREALGTDSGRP